MDVAWFSLDDHLEGAVDALLRVNGVDPTYPPSTELNRTIEDYTRWLLDTATMGRWAALADGKVAGFIQATEPHDYIYRSLEKVGYQTQAVNGFCEVGKFFVDPQFQRQGIGVKLFEQTLAFARICGWEPAVAVPFESTSAMKFVRHMGMRAAGSFGDDQDLVRVFTKPLQSM